MSSNSVNSSNSGNRPTVRFGRQAAAETTQADLPKAPLIGSGKGASEPGFGGDFAEHVWALTQRDMEVQAINQLANTLKSSKPVHTDSFSKALSGDREGLNYTKLLALENETVPVSKASFKSYGQAVKANFSKTSALLKEKGTGFFSSRGITFRKYLKETVVDENIHPIKEVFQKGKPTNWGNSLIRPLSFGLVGSDIYKKTKSVYQADKAKEDGSLSSKFHTYGDTARTAVGQTGKSLVSWEAGGFGFALGKALLPFTAKIPGLNIVLPLGGILMGGLTGGLALEGMNHILPDPPEAKKEKEKASKSEAAEPSKPVSTSDDEPQTGISTLRPSDISGSVL